MQSHFVATQSFCPCCGYGPLDASTGIFQEVKGPEKGDISICLKCTEVLCYDEEVGKIGMVIKKIDQTIFDSLDEDLKQDIFKTQSKIKNYYEFVKNKK